MGLQRIEAGLDRCGLIDGTAQNLVLSSEDNFSHPYCTRNKELEIGKYEFQVVTCT